MLKTEKPKMNLDEILNIANSNALTVLKSLGFESLVERNGYITGRCALHTGDNCTSFTFYKNSGVWTCWTAGCHNTVAQRNIIGIIMKKTSLDLEHSVKYLCGILGIPAPGVTKKDIEDYNLRRKVDDIFGSDVIASDENYVVFDDKYFNFRFPNIDNTYFVSRGFNEGTLRKFNLRICDNKNDSFYKRIIIPIYDSSGRMVGFSGRAIDERKPKWKHSYRLQPKKHLYNINNICKKNDVNYIIVCEGMSDVWKMYEFGFENCVGVLGCGSFSNGHVISVMRCLPAVSNIVIWFDNDEAGRKSAQKAVNISKSLYTTYNIVLDDNKYNDITEMSKDYVMGIMSNINKYKVQ